MNKERAGKSRSKRRKSGSKVKTTLKIIGGVALVLVLLFAGSRIPSLIKTRETLIDFGFKNVGKLVTQQWYGRMVEDSSTDRTIKDLIHIPFTESRLIFSIDVEVLAAIDFAEIEYEMMEEENKVVISLPHAEIYKAYEVQNSFKLYLESESIFNNISAEEQQAMKDKIVDDAKEKALETGLLDNADANAKTLITNMVRGNERTKDYDVEFQYKE